MAIGRRWGVLNPITYLDTISGRVRLPHFAEQAELFRDWGPGHLLEQPSPGGASNSWRKSARPFNPAVAQQIFVTAER